MMMQLCSLRGLLVPEDLVDLHNQTLVTMHGSGKEDWRGGVNLILTLLEPQSFIAGRDLRDVLIQFYSF